ncbi:hypothetical protein [Sphingobium sp. CFD-2]|uniref:hypothetical protein n=1 Tax=Sphingobium sp. CFD-2 TaxID=2878542 RepID=UPI00214B1D44|nr:hypothetical protein [Sphingobium sp. CFD-2]
MADFYSAVDSRCVTMNRRGEISTIELSVDFLPSLGSPSDQGRLDRPEVIKAAKRQDGFAPHSVAKICVIPAPSPNGDEKFFYLPAVGSLTIGLTDFSEPTPKRPRRSQTAATAELGLGLTFDRVRYDNPTDAEVQDAIRTFIKMDRTHASRQTSYSELKLKNTRWETPDFCELGLLQLLSQIPVDKGYFGHGVGIDLLEHALVGPMNRAKQVKKSKQALSRAKALNLWWCDTVENPGKRNKPPLVIL